tara:strand:- start:1366 stop:1791 length:426 start_codon:yes stop_codon:yes gene_type:complete
VSKIDFPKTMRVELTQYKADDTLRVQASKEQRIRTVRSEQDLLFKTAQAVQQFAEAQMSEQETYKAKFGKSLPCAFSNTGKIDIRVYYGDDQRLAMTTTDYTSSAVMKYRLTLKKLASGEGRAALMASFRLTHQFAQPVKF